MSVAMLLLSCSEKEGSTKKSTVSIEATYAKGNFQPGDAISVYRGTNAAVFQAKTVSSATSAVFEGKIPTSGTGRLVAVYPALEGNTCILSLKEQKMGEDYHYANAVSPTPSFSAPLKMSFLPITGKGIVEIENVSGMQLKLSSLSVEGGKLFYSLCDFTASSSKNTYSDAEIDVETDNLTLALNQKVQIPFYLFPGEVASSKASVTLNATDDSGKVYRIVARESFSRPKVGEESKITVQLTDEMLDDSPRDYTIVYPKSLTGAALEGIQAIPALIRTKTGLTVPCVSDDTAESEYEILFGTTNREASKSVSCPDNAYIIKSMGKKLVVNGSSADQLIASLYGLERNIISNSNYFSEGRIRLSSGIEIKNETGEVLAMRHMVKNLYDFTIKESHLKTITGTSPVTVAQGACTDGKYGYYAFRNSAETKCVLYKYNLSGHTKVSEMELDLADCDGYSHVNDMVYEPSSDLIYISAWSNTKGGVKVMLCVKASTMTQVASVKNLTHSPTAIGYNPTTKVFMSRSGANVYLSGAGFTSSSCVNTAYEKYGYTNQGAGADDLYCYFPVNNGTNSQLLTFDWTGKQLWNIQINNSIESESLFVVGEKYYWWCYGSSSGRLYLLTPVMKFTPNFKGGWSDIESPALK